MLLVLCACTQQTSEFSIILGGDLMLARAGDPIFMNGQELINPWVELKENGFLDDGSMGTNYFFANLESPLSEASSSLDDMNLCADPIEVRLLVDINISLVSLANNHRFDCASDGDQQTALLLEDDDILSVKADMTPVYLDIPQGKLSVIAAEDITGSLDLDGLIKGINEANETAQIVVVSMHWGSEYQAGPSEQQQALAQQLADAGADVIWGHHPHVLQKMEWIKSSDGRDVLVMYSLGNLLSDQWMLEDAQKTALIKITYLKNAIINVEILPLQLERSTKILQIVSDQKEKEQIAERLQLESLSLTGVGISIR